MLFTEEIMDVEGKDYPEPKRKMDWNDKLCAAGLGLVAILFGILVAVNIF